MNVRIHDDFDLGKIIASGQCFRACLLENGFYRFITRDHVLYLKKTGNGNFSVSCGEDEWKEVWEGYFDLSRDYGGIIRKEYGRNAFVDRAMDYGRGLRILRQDPWEMLVSMIISQRKSIPAIRKSVETVAKSFGREKVTEYGTVSLFPDAGELTALSEEDVRKCGVGYRAPYIMDAIGKVSRGEISLDRIACLKDEELIQCLESIHGVGRKVANCVALFSYGRMACVPVDVWISRAIEDDCGGISPFGLYGENAGIIQQYVFYYKQAGRVHCSSATVTPASPSPNAPSRKDLTCFERFK